MEQERENTGGRGEAPYNTEADLAAGLAPSSRRKRGDHATDTIVAKCGCQPEADWPRTIVYIDGFNLYYGALKRTPYKWLDLGTLKHLDVAVVVTNDSDLAEPVRIVRHEFGLPVGVINPHQVHSFQLKRWATFLKRIRQSQLMASQFPIVMRDAKGAFHKPSSW